MRSLMHPTVRVPMMRHAVWALCCCTSLLLVHRARAQDDARSGIQAIEEFTVEPDYRAIRLRWRYRHNLEPAAFRVKLCEVTSWNAKYRCRDRHLMNDADKSVFSHDVLRKPERGRYEAVIYDLRMLTNYSVAVEPEFGDASLLLYGGKYGKIKLLPSEKKLITTKGFSARASRCLANSSDIEVTTGPYFGGKISVEDTLDSRCSILGNRSSPQENYTLTIMHDVCGSKLVNNSRIETTVIVHENREIVTHNSRRFLVVCSFLPETFTIRASVNVPLGSRAPDQRPFSGDAPNPNDVFTYDHYKHSNLRDSRMLADQSRALSMAVHPQADGHVVNHIAVTLFFVVAGIIGSAITVFWLLGSFRKKSQTSTIGAVSVTLDKERLMTNAKLDQRDAVMPIYATPVALVSIRPLDDGRPDCSEA